MFDIHSETIAHFIGHFQILVERAGMRLEYDRLSHAAREIDDPAPLPNVKVTVSSELGLDDFMPGAMRLGDGAKIADGGAAVSGGRGAPFAANATSGGQSDAPPPEFPVFGGGGGIFAMLAAKITYMIEPPAQLGVVVLQANLVSDQDMWLNGNLFPAGSLPALIPFEALRADLEALVALAGQLAPFAPISAAATAAEIIGSLAPALATANPGLLPVGATVAMLRLGDQIDPDDPGSEVFGGGLVIDGTISEEVPDYLALRLEARQEEATKVDAVGGNNVSAPLPQQVSTGENLLLNETALASDWLDAPVIAVAGNVTSLTLISQVNVLSDRDSISVSGEPAALVSLSAGDDAAAAAPEGMVLNVASLTEVSVTARAQLQAEARKLQAQKDAADTDDEPETILPDAWAVTRIEGDLLIDTWTLQVNLLSDDDVAQFATGGHGMKVDLGNNVLVDLSTLLALGSHYDLIMVGGNMIDLTSIQQTNVLLDNDQVLLMGGQGGGAPQGIGNLSTHGNALWNEAHVEKMGIDYHTALSEGFDKALQSLAKGVDDLSSIISDALFEGYEFLRVLYIEGDLIRTDTVTQVNILGDSDQVAVLAENFEGQGLMPLDLTTGENILANIATLRQAGLDSTVMAGGEVYTDAVIWQAGMIDTNDNPLEGGIGGLASEAVAFLADGMIDPVVPGEVDIALTPDGCCSGGVDVMHSVLT